MKSDKCTNLPDEKSTGGLCRFPTTDLLAQAVGRAQGLLAQAVGRAQGLLARTKGRAQGLLAKAVGRGQFRQERVNNDAEGND